MIVMCTNQQDAGTQVRVSGSEEEAAAGLQQGAGHFYMVMGEIRQQHLLGHIFNTFYLCIFKQNKH